jgi:L-fuconolactonase
VEIIDAQIHEPQLDRPWEFGEESVHALGCELAREAMDSVGVDIALINASDEFLKLALARYPDRFAACGRLDHGDPALAEKVAAYRDRPGWLAVRTRIITWQNVQTAPDFESGAIEPLFAAAEKHGLPVFCFASGHAGRLASVAQAHPDLLLIVDHVGLPQTPMKVAPNPWEKLAEVNSLARYPNVAIKFSGGHMLSHEPYPHRDAWKHLLTMVEAFGPDRLMWGSDVTRTRMTPGTTDRGLREDWATTYADSVGFVHNTDELAAGDKEKILGGTIRRLLRWPRPSPGSVNKLAPDPPVPTPAK